MANPRSMSRDAFVAEHIQTCNVSPSPKYDPKKLVSSYHSLAYLRRKCAKAIWRRANRSKKPASYPQ